MNTTNTLRAIDVDLNYLAHYNTKGSHWYVNGPGKRFQAHAQYAMGKANPDAKPKRRNYTKREIELAKRVLYGNEQQKEKASKALYGDKVKVRTKLNDKLHPPLAKQILDKFRTAKARFDAKQDAAITAMQRGGVNTLGARRIGLQRLGAQLAGSIAVGTAAGLGATRLLNADKVRIGVRQAGMLGGALKSKVTGSALLPSMIRGGEFAAKGAKFLGPNIASFTGANLGGKAGAKAFDAIVARGYAKRGQGSLKDRKVSDAYAKAYKDTYKKYLKEYSKKHATIYQPSYEFDNAVNKSLKKESDRKAGKSAYGIKDWYTPKVPRLNKHTKKAETGKKLAKADYDGDDYGYMVRRGMGWTPPKKYRKER